MSDSAIQFAVSKATLAGVRFSNTTGRWRCHHPRMRQDIFPVKYFNTMPEAAADCLMKIERMYWPEAYLCVRQSEEHERHRPFSAPKGDYSSFLVVWNSYSQFEPRVFKTRVPYEVALADCKKMSLSIGIPIFNEMTGDITQPREKAEFVESTEKVRELNHG